MPFPAILPALTALAPAANMAGPTASGLFSKTGQAVATGPTTLQTRNAINVAPVGFNLGAIMQPYQSGSPQNGGFPLQVSTPTTNLTQKQVTPGLLNNQMVIAAAAVGGLLLIALLRR